MKHPIGKIRYLGITLGFFLIVIFNLTNWQDPIIGSTSAIAYFLFYGYITGSLLTGQKTWRLIIGSVTLLSAIALVGGLLIYLKSFNQMAVMGLLLLFPSLLFFPYYRYYRNDSKGLKKIIEEYRERIKQKSEPLTNNLLAAGYTATLVIMAFLVFKSQTAESIQSPWEVLPWPFLTLYFISSLILIIYCSLTYKHYLGLIFVSAHALLSSTIALIVYQVGFGFDPFIHQATQEIIFHTGQINPTPSYYLGQYAIVVFFSHLSLVDLSLIDKIITPLFFGLIIPGSVFYVFSQWLKKNDALILALATLTIPYGGFIMSTPQNLANGFFWFTVMMSVLYFKNLFPGWALWLLTLGSCLIHPLAGIPLAIFIFLCITFKKLYNNYHKTPFQFLLMSLVFIWVMPLVFIIGKVATDISLPKINVSSPLQWIETYDFFLNLTYLTQYYYPVIFIAITAMGIIYLYHHQLLKNNIVIISAALVLLINYLIAKYFLLFGNLQNHDQTQFVNRLIWLTIYVTWPIFLMGFLYIYKTWTTKQLFTKIVFISLFATSLTISVYLSYPRIDSFQPSKLFSVSGYDFLAVRLINQRADAKHIVLANQMVGAAAIKELGFKNYYNEEFYYSMPMGPTQNLYQAYLEMVYQGARRETVQKIITDNEVNEVYLVLNIYWNNFEKIANQAKQSSDDFYNINDKIYIFKYSRD